MVLVHKILVLILTLWLRMLTKKNLYSTKLFIMLNITTVHNTVQNIAIVKFYKNLTQIRPP